MNTKHITLSFLIAVLLAPILVRAQSPEQIIGERSSNVMDTAFADLNLRYRIFNEEIKRINDIRPLDASSLEGEKRYETEKALADFIAYMDVFDQQCRSGLQKLKDSIQAIYNDIPFAERKKHLDPFLNAFLIDHNGFMKYAGALTDLYRSVHEVVQFIIAENIAVVKNQLSMTPSQQKQYNKLIAKVNAGNDAAAKAGKAAQKATKKASAALKKAYNSAH
jgi:hypothetical protein